MQSRIVDRGDSPDVRDSKESLRDAFGSGDLQVSLISDLKMRNVTIYCKSDSGIWGQDDK